MVDLDAIRTIPRFSGLTAEAEQWLTGRLERLRLGKGEHVFLEGDPCDRFYLVEQGEVKVFKTLESGRELILDWFHRGEALGEVALLDDSPEFPASAAAQEESAVLWLPRGEYLRFLGRFPEASRAVIRDLSLRVRAMRRRIEVLGEAGVGSRIAQLLQIYARQFGRETPEGLLVPVQLTRQEIASLVGARIETVIRIISRWQKQGWLRSGPEGFLILDPEMLAAQTGTEA